MMKKKSSKVQSSTFRLLSCLVCILRFQYSTQCVENLVSKSRAKRIGRQLVTHCVTNVFKTTIATHTRPRTILHTRVQN